MVDDKKTYFGWVEDNMDPKKEGRVKVRVIDVFEEMEIEDIPWANPWKDLAGKNFTLPEKGKMVMVVFEGGDKNKPEFIYAPHYNINLENKLKGLSDSDYESMHSLLFDHKTQIFTNESEGLVIDHKYNNLNITEDAIDLNLKDNNRNVNIGDSTASQQAILGNHFFDWFSSFMETLLAGGLFNTGGPTMPDPKLLKLFIEYKSKKDLFFLSHHVNLVDNNKVSTVKGTDREDDAQYGDDWKSTRDENVATEKRDDNFKPIPGPKSDGDMSDGDADIMSDDSTDITEGETSINPEANVEENDLSKIGSNQDVEEDVLEEQELSKVELIIKFLESKNYRVNKGIKHLNIVGIRNKDNRKVTNKFDEKLYVFYKKEDGDWELTSYEITTVPGYKERKNILPANSRILAFGQYADLLSIKGEGKNKRLVFEDSIVHINDDNKKYNFNSPTKNLAGKIKIKSANKQGSAESIYNFSKGSQVFKHQNQFKSFLELCKMQINKTNKRRFTYTLIRKSEFDRFEPEVSDELKEKDLPIINTQSRQDWSAGELIDSGQVNGKKWQINKSNTIGVYEAIYDVGDDKERFIFKKEELEQVIDDIKKELI